ncbi:hypothetical protein [Lactiplantibacillus modestisalitolerans]|uniref:Uncharacterized protein n=1 Tax=Lactiplantibacillus modestisalitolerans TaxID=1457219 RepID=A0ABV5WVE9_9LACO|nr:hypothetical protein [Lactiplantibacillus modestisalitolerans]
MRRTLGHITAVDHQFLDGSQHSDVEFENHIDVLSEQAFTLPGFKDGIKRIYMIQAKQKEVS